MYVKVIDGWFLDAVSDVPSPGFQKMSSFHGPRINPPTEKCWNCGRPMCEVEPFGGAGDPLAGDFTGAKLVKSYVGDECVIATWQCRDCLSSDD